eukprot:c18382_g1_i1.p1 GENE.c18382_g1_i1~~c18382_g1_i1.p1  ORF type:complete len:210 (-),score=29.01 c18382_g1_i1:430-1020(-)
MSLEEGMAVALTELANTPESEFTKEIVEKFVLETVEQSAPAETSLGFQSYPYNHLNYLARVSSTWAQEQQCPLTFQPIPLLVECSDLQQSIQAHSGAVCDSIAKFDTTKDHSHLLSLFVCLGLSGVRTLLGIRHTVGSVTNALPPSRTVMEVAFQQLHSGTKGSILTVGARALAKHCHRSRNGWWGDSQVAKPEIS